MVVKGAQRGATRSQAALRTTVLERLEAEAALVAQRFAEELHATHPLYRAIDDPAFFDRTRGAALTGMVAFAQWLRTGEHTIDDVTSEYYSLAGRDAADQLVPLEALHEPVQLCLRHLYDWIVAACGRTSAGRAVALAVINDLLEFESAVLAVLTSAYMAERFHADADEHHLRREVIDNLLSGRRVGPEFATRLIAGYGLDVGDRCVVLVGTTPDGSEPGVIEAAVDVLQRQPVGTQRLMVARDSELVAIMPMGASVAGLADELRTANDHLRRIHDIDLVVGLSSPGSLEEVPERYQEARAALRFAADADHGVAAMPQVRLFDYLVTRFDATARRMVPPELVALLHEDVRLDGALTATLQALADHDLNVGRTAKALFVHPNTVHYRLKRIAAITGREPKRLHDLVDLLVVIRALPEPQRAG